MENEKLVRLFVKTHTDDGEPLLLGVSGESGGWSDEKFGAVEKDLEFVLNFGSNEPFSVLQAAFSGFLERTGTIEQIVQTGGRPEGSAYVEVQLYLYAFLHRDAIVPRSVR